jgi:hypothetical protein
VTPHWPSGHDPLSCKVGFRGSPKVTPRFPQASLKPPPTLRNHDNYTSRTARSPSQPAQQLPKGPGAAETPKPLQPPPATAPTTGTPESAGSTGACDSVPTGPSAARLWVEADYLHWRMKGDPLPALMTTSPVGTPQCKAGVAGTPGAATDAYGKRFMPPPMPSPSPPDRAPSVAPVRRRCPEGPDRVRSVRSFPLQSSHTGSSVRRPRW